MKRSFKSLLKMIIAALVVLTALVALGAAFIIDGFRVKMPNCDQGPLAQVASCAKDHAVLTWQNSAWWYNLAEGPMPAGYCQSLPAADALSIAVTHKQTETLQKTDCARFGLSQSLCFAGQRLASNGNSRYLTILALDAACQNGLFFRGSKAILENGTPRRITKWSAPYPGVAETSR